MIGSSAIELVLGSRPPGVKENLIAYVRELARAGLAVVLVEPDGKQPLDMRSPVAKRDDDKAAQELARVEGDARWGERRQRAGVHLATTDTKRLDRYMKAAEKRYGADTVNLGVEVGRSGILIVDVDTTAEVERFVADMTAHGDVYAVPTVNSPGKQNRDGEWMHKGGGHYWFTLPEGMELPREGTGAYKAPGENGWTAYWGDRQVLIPPSVRPEGAYAWNGGVRPLPEWLYTEIIEQTRTRKAKAADRINSLGESPIDKWAAATPWEDILLPAGWTNSGQVSNCGCQEWTAPGPHDSSKSATAHDLGCNHEAYDGEYGHAPIHVWTDNPPDGIANYVRANNTRTLSKLQFVAWNEHDGDLDAACRALGIPYSDNTDGPFNPDLALFTEDDYRVRDEIRREADTHGQGPVDAAPLAEAALSDDEAGDYDPIKEWFLEHAGPFDKFRDIEPVEFLVEGVIDAGGLSNIIGPPNAGKSFLALDMAASVATGTPWQGRAVKAGNVGYVVGEGLAGFTERVKAWERVHDLNLGQTLFLVDLPVQVTDRERWRYLGYWCLHHEIRFLILDTLNRITVGVEENSAKDMSHVVHALDQVSKYADAHVSVVHHTTRDTEHGRGSTAMEGAVDTVLLVKATAGGTGMMVSITKQKNHVKGDDFELTLTPNGDSAVVTTNGEIITTTDPMALADPPMDITDAERTIAVARVVWDVAPEIGLTMAKVVQHTNGASLSRDPGLSKNVRERLVIRAVERALDAGYIDSPRGTARYVAGSVPLPQDSSGE